MTSLIETTGFVILGFLILGAVIAVTRRAIRTKAVLGLISLVFVFAVPGYALDVRKAERGTGGDVSVAANETVDDTLVVFADSVRISGTITGDLIAFARNVDIQGTVQGNVIGFGQRIDVSGNVDGDIFAFGQSIRTDGQIGQNFWGFGQTVTVGKDARLNHDATIFAANSYLNGDISRDAMVRSGTLDVGGRIGRDLSYAGGALLMHAPSVIGRNLDSMTKSEKEVKIDPGVTIGGKKKLEFFKTQPSQYRTFSFYTKQALRIGAAFFMGLLLYWIIPGMRRISLSTGRALLTSGGIGFLAAVAAPIAAIILAITLIGIPVALLLVVLWLLGLYLAKIVVAKCIGSAILGTKSNGLSSTLLPLLVGLVIVIIAVNLPYIGGVLNFLLMIDRPGCPGVGYLPYAASRGLSRLGFFLTRKLKKQPQITQIKICDLWLFCVYALRKTEAVHIRCIAFEGSSGMKMLHRCFFVLIPLIIGISAASAQQDQIRSVRIPRVSRAPKLEDFLNNTPREAELKITDFRQFDPGDGDPVSQPTTAYLSYDDKNLYVAFVCKDDPSKIRAQMTRRDALLSDDRVDVSIDTFHDHRRNYWFEVNPYGIQMDGTNTERHGRPEFRHSLVFRRKDHAGWLHGAHDDSLQKPPLPQHSDSNMGHSSGPIHSAQQRMVQLALS